MVAAEYPVLLDTNILMSKTLRDWILLLAVKSEYEFFTPHVSSGIMDEFGYHVRRTNPAISDAVIENWKQQIIKSCISCISGFPVDAPASFPDTDDLHVHAAAQHGAMHALVTDDRKLLDYASTEEAQNVQNTPTLLSSHRFISSRNLMLVLRGSRRLIFLAHLNEQGRVNLPVISGLW